MYRFNSTNGFLIYPTKNQENLYDELKIQDTTGMIKKIGLAVPQCSDTFNDFSSTIKKNELILLSNIWINLK